MTLCKSNRTCILRRGDDDLRLFRHGGVAVGRLQDLQPRDVHGHGVQVLDRHPVVGLDRVAQVLALQLRNAGNYEKWLAILGLKAQGRGRRSKVAYFEN